MLVLSLACFMLLSSLVLGFKPPKYMWIDAMEGVSYGNRSENLNLLNTKSVAAEELVHQPVYISITTISQRITRISETLMSFLTGTVTPSHIYVFVSQTPFLIDKGISQNDLPEKLLTILKTYPVSIIFTENMGPHRKLLPLLSRKWDEDCVIVTMDDENKSGGTLKLYLQQLLKYYVASHRDSVVGLKVRKLSVCDKFPWNLKSYRHWSVSASGRKEMLLLPTGTGGVLYRPRFFHPIVFDEVLRNLTHTADDLMFRLCTLANYIPVTAGCRNFNTTTGGVMKQIKCPGKVKKLKGLGEGEFNYTQLTEDFAATQTSSLTRMMHFASLSKREEVVASVSASQASSTNSATAPASDEKTAGRVDERLLAGLSSTYNNIKGGHGNDLAWTSAVSYLAHLGVLNMTTLVYDMLPIERRSCFGGGKVPKTCGVVKCAS